VIVTAAGAAIVGRVIGYVIGREFGYRLLLRYGSYVGLTTGRIKLGQYLFVRHGGKIIFAAQFVPLLRTFAGPFAGANVMPWRDFPLANAVSSSVWAASYDLGAYWTGREFEQLQGRAVVLLVIIGILVIVAGIIFMHRHEDRLIAQAERAMPGPLRLR
jgi:membrane protein DedA with SNARE-associated domain